LKQEVLLKHMSPFILLKKPIINDNENCPVYKCEIIPYTAGVTNPLLQFFLMNLIFYIKHFIVQ
jgi:hypothetical protein